MLPLTAFVDSIEKKVYTTTRTGGAPGSGTWSTPVLVFDITAGPLPTLSCIDLSAGALSDTDDWGLVVIAGSGYWVFLGNGPPDVPTYVSNGGQPIQNFFGTSNGAFRVGGIYYYPQYNDTDGGPCVYKSPDAGATFIEADAAHHPIGISLSAVFMTQRVGNFFYLFMSTAASSGTSWQLYPFNMSTGLWEAPYAPLTETIHSDFLNTNTNGLYVWPNGDVGILYNNSSNLPVYRLWTKLTNSWGAEIATPGGQYGESLMDPSLMFIHGWNYEGAFNTSTETSQVDYFRITQAGSVTTISTIPACVHLASGDGLDHPAIIGNLILIPRDDTNDLFNAVWVADLTTGTFFKESLGNETELNGPPTCSYMVFPNGYSMSVGLCQLTISPPAPPAPGPLRPGNNCLRWQIEAPSRPGRWFAHRYDDAIVSHYIVEPSDSAPNDQELYLLGANVWQSGGDTDNFAPINVCVLVPSNDQGDERSQKLYPDGMVQCEGVGTLNVTPAFDNALTFAPTLAVAVTGPIIQAQVNIASLGDLRLYRNIGVALAWTGGPSGPRVLAWEPAAYIQPYLSKFLVTQFINLSYPGWKCTRRMYPALISVAPVYFTIKCQDGRTFTYTIPSTNGQFFILPMMSNHGLKDLSMAFQLDGAGSTFALFPDAFTVEFKGWGDPEFLDLAIFKT